MINEKKSLVRIKPWMGALGFLGFLGPVFYIMFHNPNAFLLNGLLSFFAFYWHGKLSNELKSEKFMYNKMRAGDISGKTGLIGTAILLANGSSGASMEGGYAYLIMSLPVFLSFIIIQRCYLIYKYEKEPKNQLAN